MTKKILIFDKIDRKILASMEKNSRKPIAQIANECAISREVANYRLSKLISSGFIKRLHIEPNLNLLGYRSYRLYFRLVNINNKVRENLDRYFKNLKACYWFAICGGIWDYVIRLHVRSEEEFETVYQSIVSQLGAYIRNKNIALSIEEYFEPVTYLLGSDRTSYNKRIPQTHALIPVDETDEKILFHLFDDSRIPISSLAKKINVAADTVYYRVKNLEKNKIIKSYVCWFDRRKIGYNYHKILFWFQNATADQKNNFQKFCEEHPHVVFINKTIGDWDIEIDVDATDILQLNSIIREFQEQFSEIIQRYETLDIIEDFTLNPFLRK